MSEIPEDTNAPSAPFIPEAPIPYIAPSPEAVAAIKRYQTDIQQMLGIVRAASSHTPSPLPTVPQGAEAK